MNFLIKKIIFLIYFSTFVFSKLINMVKEMELTEDEMYEIVQKFKNEIRNERGMTQRFVSTKIDVDETYLSDLLNGYKPLTDSVRQKLNDFLGTKF